MFFFGRDKEIEDLSRMIKFQQMVVLYGKSGLGKSSLLNAGVIPKIKSENNYEPIPIRFTAWTRNSEQTPLDISSQVITEETENETFLNNISLNDNSFWFSLKTRHIRTGKSKFILFFDQFEELFSYPDSEITAFKKSLAEVLTNSVPERIYRRLEILTSANDSLLTDEQEDILDDEIDIKIVFTIRSDRMHLLDKLSDHLPLILSNNYELKALQPEDARNALVKPALLEGPFEVPPFEYDEPAIREVIDYLRDDEDRIESIQLQLLCQSFEEKVKQENIRLLTLPIIGDLEDIISNYYQTKIETIESDEDELAARKLIEEGLVLEGEENNMRLSMHEGQILGFFSVGPELLQHLVDNHLLRAEPSPRGGYTYELCHDTLIGPVLDAKKERLTAEKKVKEAEEAARKEAAEAARIKRAEEQQKLVEEQKKRRRNAIIAFFGIGLASIAIVASIIAFVQYRKAQELANAAMTQADKAEVERQRADEQAKNAEESRLLAEASSQEAIEERNKAIALSRRAQQAEAEALRNYRLAETAREEQTRRRIELANINEELTKTQIDLEGKVKELQAANEEVVRQTQEKEEAQRRLKEEEYAQQAKEARVSDLLDEIKSDSLNANLYNELGVAYYELEDYNNGLINFSKAIELDMRELHIPYYNSGLCHSKLGDSDQAIFNYESAIKADSTYGLAYNGLGIEYQNLGNDLKAIEILSQAIASIPEDDLHYPYNNRALSYRNIGEYEKAIQDFESAIEANPDFFKAYDNLADLYNTYLYDDDNALKVYNNLIAQDPSNIQTRNARGKLYNDLGEYEKALQDFSFVLDLYPNFSSSYYNRAITYEAIGEYNRAILDLRRYLELEPDDASVFNRRGNIYLDRLKDYQAAINDYTKSIELDLFELHIPYRNRGVAYKNSGQYELAIVDFEKAIELDPTYLTSFNGLGLVYSQMGNKEKAIESFTKAIDGGMREIKFPYANRGIEYIDLERYDDAISDFNSALKADSSYVLVYNYLGIAYDNSGDYDRAIDYFTLSIEKDPEFKHSAYLNRAKSYRELEEYEKAIDDLARSIEANPNYSSVYKTLDLILKEDLKVEDGGLAYFTGMINSNPDNYAGYLFRANLSADNEKPAEAIRDFSQCIRLKPQAAFLYNRRGNEYLHLDDYPSAIEDYTQAINLRMEELWVPYYNRGLAYENLSNLDQAILDYTSALELKPNYQYALSARGILYDVLQKPEEALKDFTGYLNIVPTNNPGMYNRRGNAYLDLGRNEEAIEDYTKAIELNMRSLYIPYRNRGLAYNREEQYDLAIQNYLKSLELNPTYITLYNDIGLANFYNTNYQEAIRYFDLAIEQKMDQVYFPYYNKGRSNEALGNNEQAILDYQNAIAAKPDYSSAVFNLGYLYSNLKRYQEAIETFGRYIELLPTDPVGWNNRGYYYSKTGEYDKALSDLNKSLELEDDPNTLDSRAFTYLKMGDLNKAQADISRALQKTPESGYALVTQALIFSRQGNKELFYQTLEEAVNSSDPYPLYDEWKEEALFDPYENEQRFKDLINRSEQK